MSLYEIVLPDRDDILPVLPKNSTGQFVYRIRKKYMATGGKIELSTWSSKGTGKVNLNSDFAVYP
jgi:hypothetical protein